MLISDEPAFDQYWLEMLLKTIDATPLVVHHINALTGEEIRRVRSVKTQDQRQARVLLDRAHMVAMAACEAANRGQVHEHRALPDAQEIWREWKAVHAAIDGLIDQVTHD